MISMPVAIPQKWYFGIAKDTGRHRSTRSFVATTWRRHKGFGSDGSYAALMLKSLNLQLKKNYIKYKTGVSPEIIAEFLFR
jgi:hypothetical protein